MYKPVLGSFNFNQNTMWKLSTIVGIALKAVLCNVYLLSLEKIISLMFVNKPYVHELIDWLYIIPF